MKLPIEGKTLRIDHLNKTYVSRSGLRGGSVVWDSNDADCRETANAFSLLDLKRVGEVVIAGVRSVEYEGRRSSTSRTTVALAPSLGCTQMRNIYRDYNRLGVPTAFSRTEAVSVQIGEPDPALFQVPTDYRQTNQ